MKQLKLFDEDCEIFCEGYIYIGGVEYVPKILQHEGIIGTCDNCEFVAVSHPCMKARCIPGERQDQQDVIWIRKEIQA